MINEYKTQQLLDFASTSRRHLTRNPITAVKHLPVKYTFAPSKPESPG